MKPLPPENKNLTTQQTDNNNSLKNIKQTNHKENNNGREENGFVNIFQLIDDYHYYDC